MKPRVAFFDFASCEGCQLQVVNLEEKILDLIDVVEVVSFREAMKEHSDDYDIAFIEGSIQRPMDEERLKRIRANAKILIALGACACIGGVNRLRNEWSVDNVKKEVYKDADIEGNELFNAFPTKSVDECVEVDFYIPGCPIDRNEFTKVVSQIAIGRKPKLPSFPVCVECKKNENICVFEMGKYCLGPVTRAGCNAICPSFQDGCEGCRGFLDDPRMDAHKDVLRKYGIKLDEMMKKFNMFNYRKGVY
jgi:coenzyme F420-reducing hydrogenase gamma subunit